MDRPRSALQGGSAAANEVVTGSVPLPGTVVNGATSFMLYTTGSNTYAAGGSSSGGSASSSGASTPAGTFTAGTYEVGAEIQPGTYRTPGASYCYYARLKNADNELGSIIANDIVQGQGTMTVKSSDKYVEFSGSCTWTKQ